MTNETLAARFVIDVGIDEATGDKVASVVRDDGRHLNLEFINSLIDLGEVRPSALETLHDLVDELNGQWDTEKA